MTLIALFVILIALVVASALISTDGVINLGVKLGSLVLGLVTAYFALRVHSSGNVSGVSTWAGFTGLWCLLLAFLLNDTAVALFIRVCSVLSVFASFYLIFS